MEGARRRGSFDAERGRRSAPVHRYGSGPGLPGREREIHGERLKEAPARCPLLVVVLVVVLAVRVHAVRVCLVGVIAITAVTDGRVGPLVLVILQTGDRGAAELDSDAERVEVAFLDQLGEIDVQGHRRAVVEECQCANARAMTREVLDGEDAVRRRIEDHIEEMWLRSGVRRWWDAERRDVTRLDWWSRRESVDREAQPRG